MREVYGDRVAYVPYTIPGFALAKSVADVFDKNPNVEGLVLLQHGIFTVGDDGGAGLQPHDRIRHHGGRPAGPSAQAAGQGQAAGQDRLGAGDRADPARRGGAREERHGRHRQAADPGFPHQSENPRLCEWRGTGALQPAGRGDARPHHPHQELADDRARAGSRQAGRMGGRSARRGRMPLSPAITTISPATTPRAR